jgi:hypothetical protein
MILQWARHFEICIHNSYNSLFYDFKYCIGWLWIPERRNILRSSTVISIISVDTNMELSCLFDYCVDGYIKTNILVLKRGRIPQILLICCNKHTYIPTNYKLFIRSSNIYFWNGTNVKNESGRKTERIFL